MVGIPQPHFTHSSPAEVNRDLAPIVGHNIREGEIDRCHLAETNMLVGFRYLYIKILFGSWDLYCLDPDSDI